MYLVVLPANVVELLRSFQLVSLGLDGVALDCLGMPALPHSTSIVPMHSCIAFQRAHMALWSPATHRKFRRCVRQRAWQMLLLGYQLQGSLPHVWIQLWIDNIIPQLTTCTCQWVQVIELADQFYKKRGMTDV